MNRRPVDRLPHWPGSNLLCFGIAKPAAVLESDLVIHTQTNTDENAAGGEDVPVRIWAVLHTHLDRFSQDILQIAVHLSDADEDRSGASDKLCLTEARRPRPLRLRRCAPATRLSFEGLRPTDMPPGDDTPDGSGDRAS